MTPVGDAEILLNAKDKDGKTILHLAMTDQRVETIRFLLDDDRVDRDIQNEYGWTAKDIFKKNNKNCKTKKTQMSITLSHSKAKLLSSKEINKKKEKEKLTSWFSDQRNSLMIVASLVATMAFQASLTPPFTNDKGELNTASYKQFLVANSIGLASSMSSIMLLISGLPGRRFFVVLVMVLMWMAVSFMPYTYAILLAVSITKLEFASHKNPEEGFYDLKDQFVEKFVIAFVVWALVMALILLWHLTAWTMRLCKRFYAWLRGWSQLGAGEGGCSTFNSDIFFSPSF